MFVRTSNSQFVIRNLKVGVAGFEPTTSTSQMWRDTGLRYTPNYAFSFLL
jgi:hypothetical protein